jgi:spermidine/putrescine-binding protein
MVEVTFSNNEEMIAKLRATGGAGFDLAQPSHDRIYAAQLEYDIYKPLDLSKIDTDAMQPSLLDGVKANTTIDGEVYAVPHQWGTSGLMANKTMAPDVKAWGDLCDPAYKGKTSMRLRRTILLGTAFDMGEDPFAAYADLDKYQEILDKVADKLIECKDNIKAYWKGGDDLSAMMLSGEIVASETWDSTAYKLYGQNKDIVFVPPKTGALAWIDTFAIPRKGEADDAAYKWINFVLRAGKREDHVGKHRCDCCRRRRQGPAAGRQEGCRQRRLHRSRHQQPEVLCQHPPQVSRTWKARRLRRSRLPPALNKPGICHLGGIETKCGCQASLCSRTSNSKDLTHTALGTRCVQSTTENDLECIGSQEALRLFRAVDDVSFEIPKRLLLLDSGPVRLWQDHIDADDCRFRVADIRRHPDQGQVGHRDAAEPAQRQDGVPASGLVPDDERL